MAARDKLWKACTEKQICVLVSPQLHSQEMPPAGEIVQAEVTAAEVMPRRHRRLRSIEVACKMIARSMLTI